jgi:hypothetical protein
MKLSLIIGALRERCPFFSRRVSALAAWKYLPSTLPALPAAFVMPGEEAAAAQQSATDYWQTVTEAFAVAVLLDATPAENGEDTAFDSLEEVKAQLWKALCGMRQEEGGDIIVYTGARLLEMADGRLCYQFDFACDREIHEEMTRQHEELAALDAFHQMGIDLDPIAADGRPDGNVDHHGVITFPT